MNDVTFRLQQRLSQLLDIPPGQASRVVDEVIDAFEQTVDEFIEQRHAELQRQGLRNDAIYARIRGELGRWRFRAPELTDRQIRRRVYG